MENDFNRAKQFMSFDALDGYKKTITEKEKTLQRRKQLSEDEYQELSLKFQTIKVGDLIEILYYFKDKYIKIKGEIIKINIEYRYLIIDKNKIYFKDIYDMFLI